MRLVEKGPENFSRLARTQESGSHGRAAIDQSLRLKIEQLCLEELNKSCSHLSADQCRQIKETLLRIVSRISEPLLGQIREVNGNGIRRAHNLRMITEAFELQEVRRGQ